ncbi:MAG: helix-turn-helix domain-containing protein [Lachnospiraceae bacterium]|nr:helix-turn-helix domain-containing protein [Lachnospiraceae bacterium]
MTTGEKIAALRKEKGITQEELAERLNVVRQTVSRWEMDAAFPETEKLIKLSRILECSIDFLLSGEIQQDCEKEARISARDCFRFIQECTYCFLATNAGEKPRLRPMGFVYADEKALYLATDTRKGVYEELIKKPYVELASYNLNTRRWIRISGKAKQEESLAVREEMEMLYPMIRQEYVGKEEVYFVIFKIRIEEAVIA